MKQCPKCQASISDTAKFCIKCGCNIKKFEEEQAQQTYFCPECGTKFSGGTFCPECGHDINEDLSDGDVSSTTLQNDAFGDEWLTDIEIRIDAELKKEKAEKISAFFHFKNI